MPVPAERDKSTCPLLSITSRHQVLLVDVAQALPGDAEAEDIIVTNFASEKYDCKYVKGISEVYNVRAYPEQPAQQQQGAVFFRNHPCGCVNCIARKKDCLARNVTGAWKAKKVKAPTAVDAYSPTSPFQPPLVPSAPHQADAAPAAGEEDEDAADDAPLEVEPAEHTAAAAEEEGEEEEEDDAQDGGAGEGSLYTDMYPLDGDIEDVRDGLEDVTEQVILSSLHL